MNEKKRILLVDDEPSITQTLALYLEGTGEYEVRGENKPLDALRTARAFKPHLVLLDVSMPGMDGGELAAIMQKDVELSGMTIVFLTGLVRPEEIDDTGSEIGGHPFMAKPVDPSKLIACIEKYTLG
jgi:two-component system, OmpR family, alkaline phosphatase synthesis response regulator PhoP